MAKDRKRVENEVKKEERRIAAEYISHRYKRHTHRGSHTTTRNSKNGVTRYDNDSISIRLKGD